MNKLNEEKLIKIIQEALEIDYITMESISENVDEWDSLGQLNILASLDEVYDGKIGDIMEMAEADSVKKIIQILRHNSLM